jgi:uroporphyrinogen decarboxylase
MTISLTPRERFGLLVIDEPQDRIPIYPLVTSHAATVAGIKLRDYYTDGRKMAQAQLLAQEFYGHDFISFFSEVGLIAEALGSRFDYPENDLPVLRQPLLRSVVEDRIVIPDFRAAGRSQVYYDALDYAYEAIGDRVPILAFVPAPFTTALHLVTPEEFLVELTSEAEATRREATHRLLQHVTDATIEFLLQVMRHCGLPLLVDPLASGSVISPRTYREFALPYERRLIDFLHRYDLDVILHICGDTTPMLELLPLTNADLVSLDRVDLVQAKERLGDKLRLVGNFNTSRLLLARPEEIEAETGAMVAAARDNRKGYIAATGCEVPLRTPSENVKAFMRGAKAAAETDGTT